jgi:DNA polymerase III subunit epsilon
MMRQIALDIETTGKLVEDRIIEIGCIEILNRRVTDKSYHQFLQPDRKSDAEALAVHGISDESLKDKPRFNEIVNDFMNFIKGAELLIHNSAFDTGFINRELALLNKDWQPLEHYCQITDTLALARQQHPGQKNNLDALCKRYGIDNSSRQLHHGALLDAEILAEVYLTMTGGQVSLLGSKENSIEFSKNDAIQRISSNRAPLTLIIPTEEELQAHHQRLAAIEKSSGQCLWLNLEN